MRGTIVKRELKDGAKRYHAVFRDPSGKQRWKAFVKKRDAEKFLTNSAKQVMDGSYQHVKPANMNDVFDRWREP